MSLNSVSPLQIAVLGGARIGSAFAFHLVRDGHHDVTLIARPNSARLAQLQRDRGVITTAGDHAAMTVADMLDERAPYDLLLVTALRHQIAPLLPALRRRAARSIQFMFKTFEPERLQQSVDLAR